MNFTICMAEQRSPEWFAARCGRLTGSRAGDVLASIKSGEAAARRDYRMQLVCERLTNTVQEDGFVSPAMAWGIEKEADAFRAYESLTGEVVERTGFLAHVTYQAGCSLDGHIRNFSGIIEIKAPKSSTHLRYVREGVMPKEHVPQVLHNLWISDAEFCDFLSYDPRFPVELQTFLVRVKREDVDLKAYEAAALKFLDEVQTEYDALRTMTNLPAVLKEATLA